MINPGDFEAFQHPSRFFDLHRRWPKFRKHLRDPDFLEVYTRMMRAARPDFDPDFHIPREAGWCLDTPWPRSRAGVRAYHMYGHCHVIAPVMLHLSRMAYPSKRWALVTGNRGTNSHTAVTSLDGYLVDVNMSDLLSEGFNYFYACDLHKGVVFEDIDDYYETRLNDGGRSPFLTADSPIWKHDFRPNPGAK